MLVEQHLIATGNVVLERQGRNGAARPDALGCKLGALGKDELVGGLKLRLVADAEEARREYNGQRRRQRHGCQLPAKDERDGQAADDVENRDEDKAHVCAEQLLQLRRVAGHDGRQAADRVPLLVEEGDVAGDDIDKILLAVDGCDVLQAVSLPPIIALKD